jgi:hypothetical protein
MGLVLAGSEAPPDKWASVYTIETIGQYPAPPFPTANESGCSARTA